LGSTGRCSTRSAALTRTSSRLLGGLRFLPPVGVGVRARPPFWTKVEVEVALESFASRAATGRRDRRPRSLAAYYVKKWGGCRARNVHHPVRLRAAAVVLARTGAPVTNDLAKTTTTRPASRHMDDASAVPRAIQYLQDSTGWEVERLAAMHAVVKPSDVVYDIGAEQGDMTALLASWAFSGAVVAIEPNPWVGVHQSHLRRERPDPAGRHVRRFVGGDPWCPQPDGIRRGFFRGWPSAPRVSSTRPPGSPTWRRNRTGCPPRRSTGWCRRRAHPERHHDGHRRFRVHVLRGATRTLAAHRPRCSCRSTPSSWPTCTAVP